MTQDMQRCPNCGAYVMSNDDFCPRCDHRLADPVPDSPADVAAESQVELPADPAPVEGDTHDLIADARGDDGVATGERVIAEPSSDEEDTPLEMIAVALDQDWPTELDVPHVPAPTLDTPDEDADHAPENSDAPVSSAAATTPGRLSTGEHEAQPDSGARSVEEPSSVDDDPMDMTHPVIHFQPAKPPAPYPIPPAPYAPPPAPPPVMGSPYVTPGYAAPDQYTGAPGAQAATFIQQRVESYRRGGYRLRSNQPNEAVLTQGKRLGVGGWMLAFISLVGVFWYLLLLVLSGFQADAVYIVLETDGFIYEDGPGAAHTRRHRMRVGRRWAMFGMMLGVVSVVLGIALGIVAGMVLTQERYQAALREAYPAVTLFEEQFSATEAAPDDVSLAKDGAVAFAILAGIAVVGLWGGITLFVIGTIHAGAYRVTVPPLPGWG